MYFFYSVNFTFKKLPLFCSSVLHMSLALDHVFFQYCRVLPQAKFVCQTQNPVLNLF